MPQPKQTWTVYFRTGGTMRFKWQRTATLHESQAAAMTEADEIRRMGYAAHYERTDRVDSIGLPTTYDGTRPAIEDVKYLELNTFESDLLTICIHNAIAYMEQQKVTAPAGTREAYDLAIAARISLLDKLKRVGVAAA